MKKVCIIMDNHGIPMAVFEERAKAKFFFEELKANGHKVNFIEMKIIK